MNTNKTIGQIVANDFRAAEIFKNAGIDFCCGGNKTIEQACNETNTSQQELYTQLDLLNNTPPIAGTNYKDWDADFLCDYIVNTHHKIELNWLEQLKHYTQKIAEVHGASHPEVITIANLYQNAYNELIPHFEKEEQVLFPAIRETMKSKTEKFKPIIIGAIRQMSTEHETAGGIFDKISKLSNRYQVPADGCNTYHVTYKLLEQLENDIHIHIHLENNVLFPKALELAK
ncbi:MAG: iron-sulfur cluster repair di-iron protein [Paludibacteraceae bacterium]